MTPPRLSPLRVATASLVFAFALQAVCVYRVHGGDWTGPALVGERGKPVDWSMPVAVLKGSYGYDGQFTLMLALDPFLSGRESRGLDQPEYRARRILWPLLAFLLGLGSPIGALIALYAIQATVLAAGSWVVASLADDAGRSPAWGWVFVASLGVVVCLWRLTGDGVMVALLLIAFHSARSDRPWAAAGLAAAAALQKESALLAVPILVLAGAGRRPLPRAAGPYLAALPPVFAWWTWVHAVAGGPIVSTVAFNFDLPGRALVGAWRTALARGGSALAVARDLLPLTALSAAIVVGLAYGALALRRRARGGPWEPAPLLAAAYAALGLALSGVVWVEAWAYARSLLPLTTFCLVAGLVAPRRPVSTAPAFAGLNGGLAVGLATAAAGIAFTALLALGGIP